MGVFNRLFGGISKIRTGSRNNPVWVEGGLSAHLASDRQLFNLTIGKWPGTGKNRKDLKLIYERWQAAVKFAQKYIRHTPYSVADRIVLADLLRMGHAVDVRGAGDECLHLLNEALKMEPKNAEAHFVLGSFYLAENIASAPLAEQHLLEAARLANPNVNPETYEKLGFACLHQKKMGEAVVYFENYMQLAGEVPPMRDLVTKLKAGHDVQINFKQKGLK